MLGLLVGEAWERRDVAAPCGAGAVNDLHA